MTTIKLKRDITITTELASDEIKYGIMGFYLPFKGTIKMKSNHY